MDTRNKMNILKLLSGPRLHALVTAEKDAIHFIKKGGDALLSQSSPEQENTITPMWYRQSQPNSISFALIIPLLLTPLIWGWSTLIHYFELSTTSGAILSLSILPFFGIYLAFILLGLKGGFIRGLLLICYFYIFNVFLTLLTFSLLIIKAVELNEWIKQLDFFPVQITLLCLCHYLMNSNSFYKLMSFYRTTRLILEAKKVRESQNKIIK
ncbi:TPA: hypothetical protein QCG56_004887 [Enterobacter cancerogenus]|nr:hypothetical protein [Enterobacter cancerogenus]HDR2270544.1 hypothetical protein [Enterobacter cancerogenus]